MILKQQKTLPALSVGDMVAVETLTRFGDHTQRSDRSVLRVCSVRGDHYTARVLFGSAADTEHRLPKVLRNFCEVHRLSGLTVKVSYKILPMGVNAWI